MEFMVILLSVGTKRQSGKKFCRCDATVEIDEDREWVIRQKSAYGKTGALSGLPDNADGGAYRFVNK